MKTITTRLIWAKSLHTESHFKVYSLFLHLIHGNFKMYYENKMTTINLTISGETQLIQETNSKKQIKIPQTC